MKKIKIFIVLLLVSTLCSAQEVNSEARENPAIEVSKLDTQFFYYELPLQLKIGWLYRYNTFSIFPNTGIRFSVDDTPIIGISAGFALHKGIFSWSADVFYNVFPFTLTQSFNNQLIFLENNFSIAFLGGNIIFPSFAGKKVVSSNIKQGNSSEEKRTTATVLEQGVGFNIFLTDVGFFKSTAFALFSIESVPADKFFSYTVRFDVPATFSLYYVDIALMYQFLHSDELIFDGIKASVQYNTGNKWSSITGRTTFPSENTLYKTINSVELELRWYMLRHFIANSNFFISVFSQVGCGMSDMQSLSLLYEYGMGLGYTLYDSVPFTFQLAFDKDFKPSFYLSVVSKIAHRP